MNDLSGTTVNLSLKYDLNTIDSHWSEYDDFQLLSSQMMFVAISFGPNGDRFWNQITYHSSKHLAERWALENLSIGGCIGYVIIKTGKDAWCVWDEVGAENVTISQVGSFFSIQPAPTLQLV